MSEPMPEMTEEEARMLLEELVEMAEEDREGYEGLLSDLGTEDEDDPARAHAEWLLQMLSAGSQERNNEFIKLLNEGLRQQHAEEESNQP